MLADVHGVTRALAHLVPLDGHVLRSTRAFAAARDEENDDEREPHRAPTGWHIRHGIVDSGWRLDQPAGCGLPPTPPTLWHCTHSCSPAPPWHDAHAAGSRRASRPCLFSPAVSPTQPAGCGLPVVSPATPRAM